MNNRTIRMIAATTMLTVGSSSPGCGYFLHPERRGNRSDVDAGSLVMDLLWLLPGIIPGVVALIVDFSSGAVYVRGRTAVLLPPDGRVAVRLPSSPTPMRLEFRLVTSSERVLAYKTAIIGPSTPAGQSVELKIGGSMPPKGAPAGVVAGAGRNEKIYLEIRTENGATARFPTSMEAALGT
jgi:hypothetical protein